MRFNEFWIFWIYAVVAAATGLFLAILGQSYTGMFVAISGLSTILWILWKQRAK
jgi:hypothetical protein